jgi:hypothetical protein
MSNLFTYLLEGNLNLSVTMTTISSITAFGIKSSQNTSDFEVIFRRNNSYLDFHIGTAFAEREQHQDALFGYGGYSDWTFGTPVDWNSFKKIQIRLHKNSFEILEALADHSVNRCGCFGQHCEFLHLQDFDLECRLNSVHIYVWS